jgi:glycerol-3-phosphate cytidylyltransferase
MGTNVITYGTFDLFHIGHLRLLQRLRALGDRLVVAVSTDEFNLKKNKRSFIPYEHRAEIVASLNIVDLVIPETCWEQKIDDIKRHDITIFGMGDDWAGRFDELNSYCKVVYLPRTPDVSSTAIREIARFVDQDTVDRLREVHAVLDRIVQNFG